MYMGYVAFSESGLNPTNFDGPGGTAGICPAAPVLGSNSRKLKKGDIVFVDFGIGIDGYSTDKTQLYSFGKMPDGIVTETYEQCLEIMQKTAAKMIPGNIPSVIYEEIMHEIPKEFQYGFMGYKDRTVKFLGHGIGLHIDEYPVIAKGFDEPFEKNMVLAIEPKRGIENYGIIGTEETFLIGETRANCLTAKQSRLILV
jgi:Xaa-Pro aminopeptidase